MAIITLMSSRTIDRTLAQSLPKEKNSNGGRNDRNDRNRGRNDKNDRMILRAGTPLLSFETGQK